MESKIQIIGPKREDVVSYSRWDKSVWYTYWHGDSGITRDEQIFQICITAFFSYKELKEDLEYCLHQVKKKGPWYTNEQLMELGFYMQMFIDDVEADIYEQPKLQCYYCLSDVDLEKAEELSDGSLMCPHCGIDSVDMFNSHFDLKSKHIDGFHWGWKFEKDEEEGGTKVEIPCRICKPEISCT